MAVEGQHVKMVPVEVLKITDGEGKFLSAVYETPTGFTVVSKATLNTIIVGKGRIHRDAAELAAQRLAS